VEQNFGIAVSSIINLSHLITYLKGQNNADLLDKIEAYREQYGI
jgi:orotate phosphoribosyltransferase